MALMSKAGFIPTVDLGELGIDHAGEPSSEEWTRTAAEITDAFQRVGFVYLSKHGIPKEQINQLFGASAAFFKLPQEEKDKYSWDQETFCGYVPVNKEQLNSTSVNEMKETYNIKKADAPFPDEAVPEFRGAVTDFVESCKTLVNRILIALALGLDIQRGLFLDAHAKVFGDGNCSALRMINYPSVNGDMLANSTRCGPHTDYGTITLLFQDDIGGLQVRDRAGHWVNVDPIPGSLLLNIGDMMQMWTSGKFKATEHQVIIPEDENCESRCRRSVAFFLNPNDDVIISPLDGSPKFEPVTCKDYLKRRINQSYKKAESLGVV